MDNASVNNIFINELAVLLVNENIYNFNYPLNHFRRFSHILNLGVQATLKFLHFNKRDREKLKTRNGDPTESEFEYDNDSY